MRLPYLQLEVEIIEQLAPDLAVELGITEAEAGWGVVCLFKWALGRCSDDLPPSAQSVVSGPHAAELVTKSARFRGDPGAFTEACSRTKPAILEILADGIRIRGMKRYDAAWGKNHPKEWSAWKEQRHSGTFTANQGDPPGPKSDLNRAEIGPKSGRKTKTKTKNVVAASQPRRLPQGKSKTRQPSEQEKFAQLFQEQRREALNGSYTEDRQLSIQRLNTELQWLHGADVSTVQDAVHLYLQDPKRRQQNPPCSLLWFSRDRAEYLSKAKRGTP
jgi:hypothetical protein